jgi:hypothetical protein
MGCLHISKPENNQVVFDPLETTYPERKSEIDEKLKNGKSVNSLPIEPVVILFII